MEGKSFVKVNIFGNEYRVRGADDEAHIERIAAYVDGTMKEIAAAGRHVSPARIAILAAFNIADELHRLRDVSDAGGEVEDKAARLLELFDEEMLGHEEAAGGE